MSKPLAIEQVLTLLKEAPSRIADATGNAPRRKLHGSPGPDEWSANEVLAHLRACADVWGGCISTILGEEHPTIRATNPRTWIHSTDYLRQDFRESLRAFTRQRRDLMIVLNSLSPKHWTRRATITGAGKPLVRSVHDYAEWLATHERPHLKQIQRIVEAVT